jgi:hypothetical protein
MCVYIRIRIINFRLSFVVLAVCIQLFYALSFILSLAAKSRAGVGSGTKPVWTLTLCVQQPFKL